MNSDLLTKLEHWHDYWCKHLEEYSRFVNVDTKRPTFTLHFKATKWSGRYETKRHRCTYSLPYLILVKERYESTVVHEVVHAYQRQLFPKSRWHGDHFLYLLNVVCRQHGAKTTHSWDYRKTKAIAQQIAPLEKIARLQAKVNQLMKES